MADPPSWLLEGGPANRPTPTPSGDPLAAHAGGCNDGVAGAEHDGFEQSLGGPAGELRSAQIHDCEISPASGLDDARLDANRSRSAARREVKQDRCIRPRGLPKNAAAARGQPLTILQSSHLLDHGDPGI